MNQSILTGVLLTLASVSGAMIHRAGYNNISSISRALSVPLIFGGIIAGFLAIFCFIKLLGWLMGIISWFVLALIACGFAAALTGADGILSILGILSLIVGLFAFATAFLFS